MRTLTKALAALTMTAATALSSIVAVAPAAHADDPRCGGFPSIPEAYVCIVTVDPQAGMPTLTPGTSVTIPSFCYVLSCTQDQTVQTQTAQLSEQPVLVFTWNNETYSVPGTSQVDAAITALNALLAQADVTVYQLCALVSSKVRNFGIYLVCHTI